MFLYQYNAERSLAQYFIDFSFNRSQHFALGSLNCKLKKYAKITISRLLESPISKDFPLAWTLDYSLQ